MKEDKPHYRIEFAFPESKRGMEDVFNLKKLNGSWQISRRSLLIGSGLAILGCQREKESPMPPKPAEPAKPPAPEKAKPAPAPEKPAPRAEKPAPAKPAKPAPSPEKAKTEKPAKAPKDMKMAGIIAAYEAGNMIKVKGKTGNELTTFNVTSDTKIKGEPKEGSKVIVIYKKDGDKMAATSISVPAAKKEKPEKKEEEKEVRVDERGGSGGGGGVVTHSYSQPCGTPIPPGAICTCNCIRVRRRR